MGDREGGVRRRSLPSSRLGPGFWVRLVGLGLLDGLAIFAAFVLLSEGAWGMLSALLIGTAGINYVYLSSRAFPFRWLVPGLVFLLLFSIYPIIYTFYVALTNWSIPNFLTKDQAIVQLTSRETLPTEEGQDFQLFVYRQPDGEFRFLLRSETEQFFGRPRPADEDPAEEGALEDPASHEVVDEDGDGVPEMIGPFRRLESRDLFAVAGELQRQVLDIPGRGSARVQTVSSARVTEARYAYDPGQDVLVDKLEGVECTPIQGNFVCPGERELTPGWRVPVGFDNFLRVATDSRIRDPFVRVFIWNVVFAAGTVLLTLAVGLGLALTFQDQRMRWRKLLRSLLILPYAIPAFLTILVWRGLLNERFGGVNRTLEPVLSLFGSDGIPWLASGYWAKAAVLLVNLWLGFPYMMLVTMGALQAIPAELQEAARVDGASAGGVFRKVTFPLLMVSIFPLLIAAFAFNFNNFVLIFLLTRGGPPLAGYAVPVGDTDILISFTFNLAITSGRGADFALASAISIFIFLVVASLSAFGFRYTRRLEEVYGGL
jgi:arabinogalactan oligomer/maltooligosaccharide transport system permease protein